MARTLNNRGVKILKSFHLLFVMMWVIGVFTMAALYLLKPQSGDELFMMLRIIHFIDYVFVVIGALFAVVTGIIYGIFTNWGFFKNNWITVKWIVAITVILVGSFHFFPHLEQALEIADKTRNAAFDNPQLATSMKLAMYSAFIQGGALAGLVVITVFKPWKNKKKQINEK